jgi:hypothetical protein
VTELRRRSCQRSWIANNSAESSFLLPAAVHWWSKRGARDEANAISWYSALVVTHMTIVKKESSPLVKTNNDKVGIEEALLTTVHTMSAIQAVVKDIALRESPLLIQIYSIVFPIHVDGRRDGETGEDDLFSYALFVLSSWPWSIFA